jgi:hypothetical protein
MPTALLQPTGVATEHCVALIDNDAYRLAQQDTIRT